MDNDVKDFALAIGATEPRPDEELYRNWKKVFKRSNYFTYKGTLIIVKISRINRPFWGVGKQILELLNKTIENYFLVLLLSSKTGCFLSKVEIINRIKNNEWSFSAKDGQYKITLASLDYKNRFNSIDEFIKRLEHLL